MIIPIQTNNYFAKSTMPPGNNWRTGWKTREEAVNSAQQFVQSWFENGLEIIEACVFYRDGSIVQCVKPDSQAGMAI